MSARPDLPSHSNHPGDLEFDEELNGLDDPDRALSPTLSPLVPRGARGVRAQEDSACDEPKLEGLCGFELLRLRQACDLAGGC